MRTFLRTLTLLFVWLAAQLFPDITLAQSGSTDFYGRVVDKSALCSQASGFMSEQDVERLIAEMLAMQGVKNRYIVVGCQSVTNCIATVDKDKRPVILFNPSFLQRVQKLHFSASDLPVIGERDWTTLTILAHELGHHMNNHLTNPLPNATAHDMELEADETAGFLLYLMGGQLAQGKLAFSEASEKGSYTHPPRAQRYEAVTKGYNDAARRFQRSRNVTISDPEPKPDPQPDPVNPSPVPAKKLTYASVTIGTQVWMAENLNVDRFRNGDPIPEARTDAEWKQAHDAKQPAWCYVNNDPASGALFGKLYNGHAVNDPRGLAPEGWHVSTDAEWIRLTNALGGRKTAGSRLKSNTGWNRGGNGQPGTSFSGRPGALRYLNGGFALTGVSGNWWTASTTAGKDWYWDLIWDTPAVGRSDNLVRGVGMSVRCVRD